MADSSPARARLDIARSAAAFGSQAQHAVPLEGGVPYELIELFFFAYRDFVSDPDRILTELAFGRAHHRVLHFVDRNPGLTIAELLDILKITKQSLNRVLKELVEKEFIEVRTGHADRRQRHLHATPTGRALATRLASVQGQRVHAALAGLSAPTRGAVEAYLTAMIDPEERKQVLARIRKGPVG
ncbi:MAG: MarR family winged helix-turn-helix transcriptional regulator [Bosea sp. (in: a-proteobacteria)]